MSIVGLTNKFSGKQRGDGSVLENLFWKHLFYFNIFGIF